MILTSVLAAAALAAAALAAVAAPAAAEAVVASPVSVIAVTCDGQPAADGLLIGVGGPSGWLVTDGQVTIPNGAAHALGGPSAAWQAHDLQTGVDTPLTLVDGVGMVGAGCRQQQDDAVEMRVPVVCDGQPARTGLMVGVPAGKGGGWAYGPVPVVDGAVTLPGDLVAALNDPQRVVPMWLTDGTTTSPVAWDGVGLVGDCPPSSTPLDGDALPTAGAGTRWTAGVAGALLAAGAAAAVVSRRRTAR